MKVRLILILLLGLQLQQLPAQEAKKKKSYIAKVKYLNGGSISGTLLSVSDKSIELKIVNKVTNGGLTTQHISFQEIEASEIKRLTLKNKKVIASSFVAGFFLGGITGLIIGKEKQNDSESMDPQVPCYCTDYLVQDINPVVSGVVGGIMIGSVAGAIMGYTLGAKTFEINGDEAVLVLVKEFFYRTKNKKPTPTH